MLTQTEVNKLFAQVNQAFEADRARIAELEKRVKELESSKRSEKAPQTAKSTEK